MGRQLLKAKRFGILEAALALALLFILLSIGMGRYYIPLADVVKVLLGRTEDLSASVVAIISNSRLPRAAAAVFVGMALSASGVAYQAVFSNPMAAPDVLGAASGSACGAALGILLANSDLIIQLMAFIFGLGAVLLTLFLSKVVGKGKSTVIYLLLVGMVISALFKSGISIIKYFADVEDTLPAITFWLMGGLSNVKREQVSVVVPIILISLFFLLANKWKLNLLTFGDEEAAAMGVNVQRTRALVIIFSTLMSSAAISVCGLIGWVGIVVPHCARLLVGANNQRVLPVATLLGGVYLMIIDLLARMLLMVEIPLGILTALIGTPFFLWILFRGQILRGDRMMELKSREQRRANLVIAGLLLLLILVFCLSFFIGRYSMSFQEAWQGLTSNYEVGDAAYNSMIVMVKVRLPRILGALLVGGSLAMSGAAFQGVFGNPLVSPDLLGTSSGAGLAASIAILSGLGSFAVLLSALAGGLLATLLTALISHAVMRQRSGVVVYVLVGLVVSALLEAGISITKYIADPYSDLGTITYWLMGSLAQLTLKSLAIVLLPILLGALLLLWGSYKINLLSFSDEEATSMGINVKKFRLLILFAATLLCASSVAAVGVVSWVGLVVPHMTRILIGPNNKKLIPASFLTGAIYLIMIDNLARAALIFEIPISILTGAIGAPVFIFLLLKGGKTGWK